MISPDGHFDLVICPAREQKASTSAHFFRNVERLISDRVG